MAAERIRPRTKRWLRFLPSAPKTIRTAMVARFSPSRRELPEYREYTEACLAEARRVNDALGREDWQPIELRLKDDYIGAIAAYGLYDVLFVNPVIDGMNLVAMEGPLLNRRRGVLVDERTRRSRGHSRLVLANPPARWVRGQLEDLERAKRRRR